jgi:hypothetical protein
MSQAYAPDKPYVDSSPFRVRNAEPRAGPGSSATRENERRTRFSSEWAPSERQRRSSAPEWIAAVVPEGAVHERGTTALSSEP